ncbi:MAG: helicase, partial [Paenibacillus sp.]|nr:helicase [Paenibacillus sp.]
FTNAAAGEMRQRIREAIEKKLTEQPDSAHLRRQAALIHRASITTLHSFCLEVIRRNHQQIPLDPAFRIANETEAELMRQDLLSDLLEEQYGQSGEDSAFWRLADMYGGERGDDALFRLIQRIYDYSRSHPWPDHWLTETAGSFATDSGADEEHPVGDKALTELWRKPLQADVKLELQGAAASLEEAHRLCHHPEGPAPYIDNIRDDLAQLRAAIYAADCSWEELYAAVHAIRFGKLKASRGNVNKALQEQAKQLREQAKTITGNIREELFERTPEQYAAELSELAPIVAKLAELVIAFAERYRRKKAEKGLVDFADLEHYCLHILRHPDSTPGFMTPSDAARQYREQYVEILLDEYQDTNTVQEAIVELISRPAPGNRFMVGDVKQSIYRFRLAEPGLFMAKYRSFEPSRVDELTGGRKIDLAKNFRSRKGVIDGVNFIFRQILSERAGEMDYDEAAELKYGAAYRDSPSDMAVELALIDRGGASYNDDATAADDRQDEVGDSEESEQSSEGSGSNLASLEEQAETAQLEARWIVSQIRRMTGMDGQPPMQIADRASGSFRPAVFRDIVILLRATSQWAAVFMDELKAAGIFGYADLNNGYFSATEIQTMLSLLQIIDNPYQDIPIAAVLRSPMFGLTAAELAEVRIAGPRKPFYEAMLMCRSEAERNPDSELRHKLDRFVQQLARWRDEARQGSLAQLLWNIYRETGYYDFVGGMPGGVQRQANLRALYDRARQYEATSFRGLFRFLRFIERLRDSGADLGAARALGEQENVVRIMSIHKSKGLEFPVVFVAGLGKQFNQTDLNDSFLLHKELGFGPLFADPKQRVACPSLPMLAIKRRMKLEMIAEEFRVLYVALTRPKEKLILVGTVSSAEKAVQKWSRMMEVADEQLPAHEMVRARSYLDWLGPALIRHPAAETLRVYSEDGDAFRVMAAMSEEPSQWSVGFVPSHGLAQAAAAVEARFADERMESIAQLKPVVDTGAEASSRDAAQLDRRFAWTYDYAQASGLFSKTSVSELKRLSEQAAREDDTETAVRAVIQPRSSEQQPDSQNSRAFMHTLARRPKFLGQQATTAAERGTIYHAVMQHIPLDQAVTEEVVIATKERMVALQLLTAEQSAEVDADPIVSFFQTDVGQRLLNADRVHREVPFSYGLKAEEVYPDATGAVRDEIVLVQGVIDCLFEEAGELVLLDYKTDAVYGNRLNELQERYGIQLRLYARAIEHIWRRPVKERKLFFFNGSHLVHV